MPFASIQFNPGVNTVATPTALNQAGVSNSNLIRWRSGLPEKMGGWQKFVTTVMSSITRALHAFLDQHGDNWLAVGNLSSLDVITGGSLTTITPQTLTSNVALNVSTVVGSTSVTIVDTNLNTLTINDSVFFATPITIGGIILAGQMQITGINSATTYLVVIPSPATSTVSNAGAVPSFTTAAGSSTVTIAFANHGMSDGDTFTFTIPTIVGGITISGTYPVLVSNVNTFTIFAASQAVTTQTVSMNSGQARYIYNIANGPASTQQSGATGPIGQFAIGQGYSQITSATTQTGTPITASDWSLDNWGEILLACPRGGTIWYWRPESGFTSALPVGNGPVFNNGIFVAMPAQILVAWGSTTTVHLGITDAAQDALLVRWSDQLNFLEWNVTSTTQAGSFHIPTGSTIRGGIQGSGIALIFTDIDVWSMTYIGYPLIFGFNKIFSAGGLVGPHAVCEMFGAIYWMSNDNFYTCINGAVSVLPCPVWDNVFQNIDTNNISKVVAAPHPDFKEVIFFYPSAGGSGECDKYVKVNVGENFVWDVGTMSRSAWQTRSVFGPSIGADPDTLLLQQHEIGYSADGAAMDSFFETGYFAYGDGENFSVIDQFNPDMKYTTFNSSTPSASLTVTLTTVNYPNDTSSMTNSLTMTSSMEYITPRVRGRQVKWKIETNDATSWWRMGLVRYRYNVDGRR